MARAEDPPPPRDAEWAHVEWTELVHRLTARTGSFDRYTVHEEVGRGGMGRVLRVRDEDLQRDLAMKIMARDAFAAGSDPSTPTSMTARFVEEAQVAGQLDHPGIVPVHDVGLDTDGQFYFTMKLVRGRTFEKVLELARNGTEGWSMTRVLHVLLRVCEAMSYAHERGVLHRDLKPPNIMVGNHGEVYVMDWGLARLLARPDHPPLPSDDGENSAVRSARSRGSSSGSSSSPFVTENDRVVGTPTFMSPEQAAGASAELNPQADVYSVGAILYLALAGRAPYGQPGKKVDNRAVWVALQAGPPKRVGELAPKVAPELVSICEKAMARSLDERYATMAELAEDLRAYLEMRVVHAHRTGPWHELKKWVLRNKIVASSILAIILVVGTAGFWVANAERSRALVMELQAEAGEASRLVASSTEYLSIVPSKVEEADRWLTRARYFLSSRTRREAEQAALIPRSVASAPRDPDRELRAKLKPIKSLIVAMEGDLRQVEKEGSDPSATPVQLEDLRTARLTFPPEFERLRRLVAELEATQMTDDKFRFADGKLQDEYETRDSLLRAMRALAPKAARIEQRLEIARNLPEETLVKAKAAWDEAIASIADRSRCPLYGGLVIKPQLGLVPLGRNAASGLWEFWHVLSGERPAVGTNDDWALEPNTGLVLILIPGGEAIAGAQRDDPAQPRFDPEAGTTEKLRRARLDPYFISKYEFTQGQALWIADINPSDVPPGMRVTDTPRTTRTNPIERYDWSASQRLLESVGLILPTELQWEWAARAGSDKRFGLSDDFAAVQKGLNYSDESLARNSKLPSAPGNDGAFLHCAVDAFEPNGFGLYCVLGNVSEMCLDWYEENLEGFPPRDGDGLVQPKLERRKSARGGSWLSLPADQRLSARRLLDPLDVRQDTGMRPARALDL